MAVFFGALQPSRQVQPVLGVEFPQHLVLNCLSYEIFLLRSRVQNRHIPYLIFYVSYLHRVSPRAARKSWLIRWISPARYSAPNRASSPVALAYSMGVAPLGTAWTWAFLPRR